MERNVWPKYNYSDSSVHLQMKGPAEQVALRGPGFPKAFVTIRNIPDADFDQ